MRIRIPGIASWFTLPRAMVAVFALTAVMLDYTLPARPIASVVFPDRSAFACSSPDGNMIAFGGTSADGRYRGQVSVTDLLIYVSDGFTYFWNRRNNSVQSIGTGIRELGLAVAVTEHTVWLESITYETRWEDRHLCFEHCDIATRRTISKVNLQPGDRRLAWLPNNRILILEEVEKSPWRLVVVNLDDQSRRVIMKQPDDNRGGDQPGTCVSSDGKLLAVYPWGEGQVRVFDLETGAESVQLRRPESRIVFSRGSNLKFATDGRSLCMVTCDQAPVGRAQSVARVWSSQTGELCAEQTIRGLSWPSLGCFRDQIILHNDDYEHGRAEIIAAGTRELIVVVPVRGPPSDFHWADSTLKYSYDVKFGPDDRTVLLDERNWDAKHTTGWPWLDSKLPASILADWATEREITFFDLERKKRVASIRNQDFAGFMPDGRTLVTSSLDHKTFNLWDLPPGRPWLAIFGWSALPAGMIGAVGLMLRRRRRTPVAHASGSVMPERIWQ